MKIFTNYKNIENDLYEVIHQFYPDSILDENKPFLKHKFQQNKNIISNSFTIEDENETYSFNEDKKMESSIDSIDEKRQIKRICKLSLYKMLSTHFSKNLPWGSLTGIRPTKVAYDLLNQGVQPFLLKKSLRENFLVSEDKANLVYDVIQNQKCIIRNDKLVDIYINIPFCPSRCYYCSFISSEYDKIKDIMPKYLEALIKEINATKKLVQEKSYIVRTIYIGGGTPTVLSAKELDMLLNNLTYPVSEFTVECGRPDTITKEKLNVLKEHNVTRISINPQSFNDNLLKKIGRKHTVRDVIDAYKLALPYNFTINMDLIAGLNGDSLKSFKQSVDLAIQLAPDNITIHALSKKRGSILIQNNDKENSLTSKMIQYSYDTLTNNGYKPYYLYRQKNQSAGQENVGYYREKVCLFNVDSMEESLSILACGANAISKRIFNMDNRIERFANVKDIKEYIMRIDEMIEKKNNLFS